MNRLVLKEKDDRIIEGVDIQKYIDANSFTVHNSKRHYGFVFIAFILSLIIIVYSSLTQNQFSPFAIGFCSLYCVFSIFRYWKYLNNNRPQLVLTKGGIALQKFGFIPWNAIRKIKIRNNNSGESSSTMLDIFITEKKFENNPDCSVEIEYLDRDIKLIKQKIKEYGCIEPEIIGFW